VSFVTNPLAGEPVTEKASPPEEVRRAFRQAVERQQLAEAWRLAQGVAHPLTERLPAPGEGPWRLRLARLTALWLDDPVAASHLAQEALRHSTSPVQMIKEENLTARELRQLLGPPSRIARQILYRRYREQWVYHEPLSLRVELDCIRGQEPQIQTVQPLTAR
jgi:hypothetical protein